MALPNMNIGSNGGYTGDASVTPQAGVDKFLFPIDDDEFAYPLLPVMYDTLFWLYLS